MAASPLDAPFSRRRDAYEISTARDRLDLAVIHGFLTTSYWSPGVPRETVERAIAGSLNFGLHHDGPAGTAQVGGARVVTDAATFAYFADVFVLPDHRGRGLATWLMASALEHPALLGLRRFLLATRDAHAIYARVGFVPLAHPERLMEIHRPDVYRRDGG